MEKYFKLGYLISKLMNKMLITYNNLKDKTTDELILIKNQYIRTYIGDFIKPWDYI
jgi:hypothetical protein